ncbi:Helix-loop-helix DNA-binding domain protein [Cooperia oncophora]
MRDPAVPRGSAGSIPHTGDRRVELRTVLPEMDSGRRLSKYETLQMAQQYIACLKEILDENATKKETEN